MAYTEKDEKYFFEKLQKEFRGNWEELICDIEIYRLFILARSMLYHVYWTNLKYQSGNKIEREKQLCHFMRRYNKICKYEYFDLKPKTQLELHYIFEKSHIILY